MGHLDLNEASSVLVPTEIDSLTLDSSLSFVGLNFLMCRMESLDPLFLKAFSPPNLCDSSAFGSSCWDFTVKQKPNLTSEN